MRTDARTDCASFFSSFIFQQFLDAKALRSAAIGVLSLLSVGLPSQPSRVNFVSCIFHTSWYYIVTLFVITFYFVLPILPFSKNLTYIVTPCTIASLHDIFFFVNIPISVCVCLSLSWKPMHPRASPVSIYFQTCQFYHQVGSLRRKRQRNHHHHP